MPHRTFTDGAGRKWEVWAVHPEKVERRVAVAADPPVLERRKRPEFRVPLGAKWANGWLTFETRGEKRRLAPYPTDWFARSDEQLERLCASATVTKSPPRRLIE
jgi:hypothetical protein